MWAVSYTHLASTSRILDPHIVGQEHYDIAQRVKQISQRNKELQDIISILGMEAVSYTHLDVYKRQGPPYIVVPHIYLTLFDEKKL